MHLPHKLTLMVAAISLLLTGCGGSGSSIDTDDISGGNQLVYTPGQYLAESKLKDYCAIPRKGIDPFSNKAYPDKVGSALHEKLWLRSWSNRTYLWYRELSDLNPAGYNVVDYFHRLKTDGKTDSGASKDKFHFVQNTADYLQQTQSGVESGYGISWHLNQGVPPRKLTVAYTEPGSPAASAGISRGDEVRFVNGVDFVNDNTDEGLAKILAGLYPSSAGESHQIVMQKVAGNQVTYNVQSADVATTPVQNVSVINTDIGKVGYLVFNSHIAIAQPQLISAIEKFGTENISELVIDLRYNGGGLLALASQFGYMVAGNNIIQDRFFEKVQFNDKYPNTNPVTGAPLQPMPFYDTVIDYNQGRLTSQALPTLGLNRVFVLTSESTCSASEAFMNALRGVDVEVIQIGGQTCGKPYGFYPADNCGLTYFTVQFSGINAKGFGDYADGFIPVEYPVYAADVKGCAVEDDFKHNLGNTAEASLNTALYFAKHHSCPVVAASVSQQVDKTDSFAAVKETGTVEFKLKQPNLLLDNRISMPILPLE